MSEFVVDSAERPFRGGRSALCFRLVQDNLLS
ncbi:MAG: hypothetical protein [Arizlama microvirus]|nr:MAG: hypothetical protein [Arizlama microvirus]